MWSTGPYEVASKSLSVPQNMDNDFDMAMLPERLNTVAPLHEEIIEVHVDQLRAMSDEELINYVNDKLGLSVKPGWPRTQIITYLTQNSVSCADVI